MRVIDILNKIANGEKIPHFKVSEIEYFLNWKGNLVEREEDKPSVDVQWFIDKVWLNTEVEIIEEEKEIQKLELYDFSSNNLEMLIEILNDLNREYGNKINEIIDYINREK